MENDKEMVDEMMRILMMVNTQKKSNGRKKLDW